MLDSGMRGTKKNGSKTKEDEKMEDRNKDEDVLEQRGTEREEEKKGEGNFGLLEGKKYKLHVGAKTRTTEKTQKKKNKRRDINERMEGERIEK